MAYQFQTQTPNGGGYAPAIPARSLLAQVLGISALGLGVTALAAYLLPGVSTIVGFVAILVGFGLLFAINATRANEPLSLALFYAFAFCEGVGIAPTISHYVAAFGSQVVVNAATTTGLGMLGLGAIVYGTGLDLRRFQGIFFAALIGLILLGIVMAFTRFIHPEVYSYLTLVIFTGLVLIDFARIRAGGDGLTPVQMAVQIYLDAINIFLALLQIFGGRRSND